MFEKYYEHYVSLHQNRHCRRLHLFGMLVAAATFLFLLFTPFWWLGVAAPVLVYPFAWVGHIVFEQNKPATWNNPVLAALGDLRMTWDILRGRIKF